jgi:hypothetical protein
MVAAALASGRAGSACRLRYPHHQYARPQHGIGLGLGLGRCFCRRRAVGVGPEVDELGKVISDYTPFDLDPVVLAANISSKLPDWDKMINTSLLKEATVA